MNNELKHFGVLGMRWGRRKATDGSSNDGLGSIKKYRGNDPSKKLDDTKKNLLDKGYDKVKNYQGIRNAGKKLDKTYKEIEDAFKKPELTAGKAIVMTVAAYAAANVINTYLAKAQTKLILDMFENYTTNY